MNSDADIRAALDRHWAASDANDFETEHDIYRDDAVLEYPQSGERIRGRRNIQASRTAQPNQKRFTVRRIVGAGELWVTEFILTTSTRTLPRCAAAIFSRKRKLLYQQKEGKKMRQFGKVDIPQEAFIAALKVDV